jgi:hypothetical protein|tara:strand:- start:903 stop:1154 length:252 start_codon:yes stop_codon:yes gene_type:complete
MAMGLYLIYRKISKKVVMAEMELKEYMFTFEGGGWNTCWAKTRRGAIKEAVRQYSDNPRLTVIESSVKVADKMSMRRMLSNFY